MNQESPKSIRKLLNQESLKSIRRLLSEYDDGNTVNELFQQEEMSIGGRDFLVTGSASVNLVDDSDFDRETGYGGLILPEDFRCRIDSIIEIMEDGSDVDVTSDPEVMALVRNHIQDNLEQG